MTRADADLLLSSRLKSHHTRHIQKHTRVIRERFPHTSPQNPITTCIYTEMRSRTRGARLRMLATEADTHARTGTRMCTRTLSPPRCEINQRFTPKRSRLVAAASAGVDDSDSCGEGKEHRSSGSALLTLTPDTAFGGFKDSKRTFCVEERPTIVGEIDTTPLETIPDFLAEKTFDVDVSVHDSADLVEKVVHSLTSEIPTGSLKQQLQHDIRTKAREFAILNGCKRVCVKVRVTRSQQCPRFHVDKVLSRLIITYQGPGTEYVKSGFSNPLVIIPERLAQTKLGLWNFLVGLRTQIAGSVSNEQYNQLALLPFAEIQMANPADVLVLKGAAWEGCNGAVHRSPEVNEEDPPRLLLVMDVAD